MVSHKRNFLIILLSSCLIFLLILSTLFLILFKTNKEKTTTISKAKETNTFDSSSLSSLSYLKEEQGLLRFSLYKETGYLYKSKEEGERVIDEFFRNVSSIGSSSLPKDFLRHSILIDKLDDATDEFFKVNSKVNNPHALHYFYQQRIEGIPIYGSLVSFRLKKDDKEKTTGIYDIEGDIIQDTSFSSSTISKDQAKEIALNKAKEETGNNSSLKIIEEEIKPYIINHKLLGLPPYDPTNHSTLSIPVVSDSFIFARDYFVDLSSGEIVYEEEKIITNKERRVYDIGGVFRFEPIYEPYRQKRFEGEPPTGNEDLDNAYEYLGTTYDFFKDSLGRDSWDGNGAPIVADINTQLGVTNVGSWDSLLKKILIASHQVKLINVAHEFTHGVTQTTADFIYKYQSGSLNEGIADIFGGVASDNWNDLKLSYQPDRLFSLIYGCGEDNEKDDYGYRHHNAGVLKHALYLLQGGGNFNGCIISGIGKQEALIILYRALKLKYFKPSSNFRDAYDALMKSCHDLFKPNSFICSNVEKTLQATEMDQQPIGEQRGAKCLGIPPKTPGCAPPTPTPNTDCIQRDGFCEHPDSCMYGIITDANCNSQNPGFVCCRKYPVRVVPTYAMPSPSKIEGTVILYKNPNYHYEKIRIGQRHANTDDYFDYLTNEIDISSLDSLPEINTHWSWTEAITGKDYEWEAVAYLNYKEDEFYTFSNRVIVKAGSNLPVDLIIDDRNRPFPPFEPTYTPPP